MTHNEVELILLRYKNNYYGSRIGLITNNQTNEDGAINAMMELFKERKALNSSSL